MKVKIKTKDNYFDMVKLKCTAVEFLIIKRALFNMTDDVEESYMDRKLAKQMLDDIAECVKKK